MKTPATLPNTTPENWKDEEINTWFENGQWLEAWTVKPDLSINRRSFAIYYHQNSEQCKQAFAFLRVTNLKDIAEGKIELDGDNLFIGVDKYQSKDINATRYEAHKNYIDIQYVISGEEQIGVTNLNSSELLEAYNEEKDVAFYSSEKGKYLHAHPGNFFVFFPEDVHRPGIKISDKIPIKKLVVKLKIKRKSE